MSSKLGLGLLVAALALWTTGCDDTTDPFIADASPGAGGEGGGAGGMGGGAGGEGGGAGGMGGGAGGGAGGMGGGAGGMGGGAGGAGGGMGGMGGTPPLEGCDLYCSLMAENCPEAFADAAACQEACGNYGTDGEEGDTEGDTLQCRIYHAGVAADDAALHCPHAGPDGGGVCSEPCNDYCAEMMANCPEAYPDEAACAATCALFPTEGARGDTEGNSVHCRAYHAGAAADDAALHCPHASSNGGGVCGDYCENYCGIIMQTCEGSYADMDDCMNNCAALPADGEWSALDGDSVQCRTYHASFPALGDSALHCPHAGADGGSVCGSYCEVYCNRVGENCPGLYADEAECMSFCDVIPDDGDNGAADGNSVQCRIYHATLPAAMDGALHCPHASVSGGGTCGDWCDVYCDLQADTCTGDNAVFQDRDSCLATCAAYPQDGDYDATDGNSVQCRIYHSSVPAAADPVTHCPHTSQAGGGVCGSACEGYCSQVMANCDSVYDSMEQCMTVCAALPDGGEWNAVEGNSVQCRAYHASFPAVGDAATHCPHTGVLGGGVCGPTTSSQRCRFYCDFVEGRDDGSVEGACGDLYEDEFDCGVQCAEFERGAYDEQAGDSYECRLYAAAQAVSNPEMWCDAASMQGGDICIEQIADPCVDYCDLMMANCPGFYPDAASCADACALFPADGMEGDTEGNTVQCRTYHAGVAADDAVLHCPHASSNGGGVCGDYCESYCGIVMQTCPDTYADNDTCLAECALFPADGEADAVDGDSVQCRTYHASFPAVADPALHCLHTTPSGGDFCGGYCDVYCNRMEANCPESYADRGACMNACAGFPTDGVPGATEGNSVQCRIYHSSVPATMDAMLHCPHAGQGGGGVCGTYCENYCELTQANCTEANQIYPAMDACLAACEAMPQDGAMGTTEGNSIQCRTYHATVAGDDPALHCQHAGITGGGVCGANACDAYCDQVTYNCTGDNAQYADRAACVGGCVELNREGEWNATEGDSVQCRAYHASFPAAADPMTHCPHAGAMPTDFCVDPQ